MADKTLNVRVKHKYDTEANWKNKNPVLLQGEIGFINDGRYKVGNGTSKWNDLQYATADSLVGHVSGEGFGYGYAYSKTITIPKTTAATTYYVQIAKDASFRFKNYYIKTNGNNTQYSFKVEISANAYMDPHITLNSQLYNTSEIKSILICRGNNYTHNIFLVIDSSTSIAKTIYIQSDNAILDTVSTTAPTTTTELTANIVNDSYIYTSKKIVANITGSASSVPWNGVTGKPSTFTPSSHTHDDRYYTESEVESKLSAKSNNGHTHDDRYYTEAEINSKLSGKSDTNHSHNLSTMINGLSEGTAAPTDSDYYVAQYAGGANTTTTYHRRPHSALWQYIKGKADSVYQPKGSYAASSHTHSISNISGLQSALDGKANNHSHPYLPLSGGTVTSGVKITGRYLNNGDDEGLVIGLATNNYCGVCLGSPTGERSVFYFTPGKPFWRYTNSSGGTSDIIHPKKAGTIALTSDIPTNNNQLSNGAGYITSNGSCKYATSAGSANSAATINSATPTLSIGAESNEITVKTNDNGVFKTETNISNASIRSALDFKWYSTNWQVGNIRGGSTDSLGFGFAFKPSSDGVLTLKSYIDTNGVYHGNVTGNVTGNLTGKATTSGTADVANSVDWSKVANKPSTFTPSSHTHTIANINGLQTALDGKANNHSHPYVPLAGGTMTGALTAPNVTASNYFTTPTMLGEGDLSTYYHRVDFGHSGVNQFDFYEYGGLYNFYQNQSAGKDKAVLLGKITSNGWEGNVTGNLTGNASTATKLATARTISITGSVIGSGSFDGSGNLTIATTTGHSHSYIADSNDGKNTTFAYSKAGLNYGDYSWLAAWNGYELRAVNKNQFATAGHTHGNYLGAANANGFYGMAKPDGNTSDWIRTTQNGIIPYQAGSRGNGHSGIGTSGWYFSSAYVDNMYTNKTIIADKVTLQYDSTNACLNFVFA